MTTLRDLERRLEELGAPEEIPAMTPTQYMKFDMLRCYANETNGYGDRVEVLGENDAGETIVKLDGEKLRYTDELDAWIDDH